MLVESLREKITVFYIDFLILRQVYMGNFIKLPYRNFEH